jgi:protein SCO1/2
MSKQRSLAPVALVALGLVAVACAGDEATQAPETAVAATPAAVETATAAATLAATAAPETTAAPPTATPKPSDAPPPPATPATPEPPQTGSATSSLIGDPRPAPELADLVLPDGSTFDLASLRGDPVLIYFGYTHCPDVCPATLGELFGVFEALPETQALFVSVDPERDTPEFLAEWTTYMPENLHAVTGNPGVIRRAADNYGVKYARVETTSTSGYTMSHTAELYLIDADGQYRLAYPFGTPAADIVADLERLEAG